MLAPMENHTDEAFRTLCHRNGADLTFTPMARISGLARRNRVTWSRIGMELETPTAIQLIGNNVALLEQFLRIFEPSGGFRGFDLNLGCSSPDVTRDGLGSAMIRRVTRVGELVNAIHDRGYRVSIKMRLGLNKYEKDKRAYINLIEAVDADFFIVHARYGSQKLDVPPDNDVYPACVRTGKVIIANGDIRTVEQVESLKENGIQGVMIGRAALNDPTIFGRLRRKNTTGSILD